MDILTPEQRSARMSAIKSSNTKPEIIVRRLLHGLGYRFRLHDRGLPGTPDIVFRARRKVIFVHGCFWHRHEGCRVAHLPKSRRQYWEDKLAGNVARDARQRLALQEEGWHVCVLWECGVRDPLETEARLQAFLGPRRLGAARLHTEAGRRHAG